MQKFDHRFGSLAPTAPRLPGELPKVPMELDFLVKSETPVETDEPVDPVGTFIAKAQADAELTKNTSSVTDARVRDLIFAPADVRGPLVLAKDASGAVSDWGWDTPVSTDAPMSKRASPAKERFRRQLEQMFPEHEEEIAEICEVAALTSALLAEEAA